MCNTPKSQSPSDFALSTDLHYGRSMRRSLSPPSWEDYGLGPASACRAGRHGSDNGNETTVLGLLTWKKLLLLQKFMSKKIGIIG